MAPQSAKGFELGVKFSRRMMLWSYKSGHAKASDMGEMRPKKVRQSQYDPLVGLHITYIA